MLLPSMPSGECPLQAGVPLSLQRCWCPSGCFWGAACPAERAQACPCLCRNALHLINEFDFPDQSISRGDYAAVLAHLNATQPERVARLPLEACRLEDFLDKVPRRLRSSPQTWPRLAWQLGTKDSGPALRLCRAGLPESLWPQMQCVRQGPAQGLGASLTQETGCCWCTQLGVGAEDGS